MSAAVLSEVRATIDVVPRWDDAPIVGRADEERGGKFGTAWLLEHRNMVGGLEFYEELFGWQIQHMPEFA